MPTTTRTGSIHLFHPDHPGPTLDDFLDAHSYPRPPVPVEAIDVDTLATLGSGRLLSASIGGRHLMGTVEWPGHLEGIAGDEPPPARCVFRPDGSIRKVVVEMSGPAGGKKRGDARGCKDCGSSPRPASRFRPLPPRPKP